MSDAADSAASEKRRAIQAILRDSNLSDLERRRGVQRLMDGSSHDASNNNNGGMGGGTCVRVDGGSFGPGAAGGGIGSSGMSPYAAAGGGAAGSGGSSFAAAGGGGASSSAANGNGGGERQSEAVACVHYERKCNVVAPCCGRAYGCRVCHDEMSPHCGPMDRFAVTEVVCKACGTRQGSKTNSCTGCGITFAEYHCPKCNIWMDLKKRPFHCDECGFCRVGGRERFRHCARCCMCISASVYDSHSCMTDKYKNNCPVCREDMFSSRQSPQDLPCGHAIHAHCFRNLAGFDYRCPICKKTVVSRASMSAAWTARARDIQMQPMPEDLARVVDIGCNDCERKSEGRDWHFLGVQCPWCSSFNTVVEGLTSSGGCARSAT